MGVRYFAVISGVIYLAIGILGFIPGFVVHTAAIPEMSVDAGYGYLINLFPINWFHNLVHLGIGIWGVVAYRKFSHARLYSRTLAVVYGALAVMGLIPVLDTFFGLIPLFGHNVWLHVVTAAIAAYFGWKRPADPGRSRTEAREAQERELISRR